MKKVLSILLAIALMLAFSACGTEETSSSDTSVGTSSEVNDSSSQNIEHNVGASLSIGDSSSIDIEQTNTIGMSGDEPHTHTFEKATCTTPSTCECGETEGKPLGHDFNKATCTEAGKCTVCGEEKGTALGHNWNSATCTEPKSCTRCSVTEGKALGHNYKETREEGNCLQKGYIDRICTRCQDSSIEYLDVTAHKYTERYEQDSDEYHKKVYTCKICSHTYSDYLEHSFGEWSTVKEDTDTEQDERSCECFDCGYVKTENTEETQ